MAFLASAGAASADQPRPPIAPDCSDDRGVDRCADEQHRRVLALFGLPPIETHLAAGDQVRRVFYVDGYGRDVVAITFIRRPAHDPAMIVTFPRREGEGARPPLEAVVPETVWNEIVEASELFDRDLAPLAAMPGALSICMHSWVYTVEATDPTYNNAPASIRRKTQDACVDGPAEQFAQLVSTRAVPLLPYCALLDPSDHRNAATLLAECSRLSGDRSAAAHAFNAAQALRHISEPDELSRVRGAFYPDATLSWAGERHGGGSFAAARAWMAGVAAVRPTHFYILGVHGLTADRARVTASLWRAASAIGEAEQANQLAAVEQIWVREPHGTWMIESAVVGPFEATRDF